MVMGRYERRREIQRNGEEQQFVSDVNGRRERQTNRMRKKTYNLERSYRNESEAGSEGNGDGEREKGMRERNVMMKVEGRNKDFQIMMKQIIKIKKQGKTRKVN